VLLGAIDWLGLCTANFRLGTDVSGTHLLDQCNATAEYSEAVAQLDGSLMCAPCIPFIPSAHQELQPTGINCRSFVPERNARSVLSDEEITAVSDQSLNPSLDLLQCDGQHLGRQVQSLRIRKLGTESPFVLYD
jgi:hypothetical protein